RLARQAVAFKEKALGPDHPDVAISLGNLASTLEEAERDAEALEYIDRAIAITTRNGDPESHILGRTYIVRGEALVALGRGIEAEASYVTASRILRDYGDASGDSVSGPLQGIGAARLAQGVPDAAVPVLEKALQIRETREPNKLIIAETRFSLAR